MRGFGRGLGRVDM
jgi:hypothetical protein